MALDPDKLDFETRKGASYPPWVLAIYDVYVLGLSNTWVWRCPTRTILASFRRHVTPSHLDVGVGSGYYLRKGLPNDVQRLGLVDLSDHSLAAAACCVQHVVPEVYRRNVLKPWALNCQPFSSLSMNYLLHCVPGNLREKGVVLTHALAWLAEQGTLFGSTIVSAGVQHNAAARQLLRIYNSKGIFHNTDDTLSDLSTLLHDHLQGVRLEVRGSVALFSGQKPAKAP